MGGIKVRVEAVIFNQQREILLARHEKDNRSYWVLPGGSVELYENLDKALVRELKEELGIQQAFVESLLYIDEYIDNKAKRHVVRAAFVTRIDDGELENMEVVSKNEAIKEVRFFSAASIRKSDDTFYPSKELFIKLMQPM